MIEHWSAQEICTRMKWYLSCDVENGLIDSIRRSVDRIRDSFARAGIPIVEEDFARECWSLS